jgi:hypothetical protein
MANLAIESFITGQGLPALGLTPLLPGVELKLNGGEGQGSWLDTVARQHIAAGFLTGDLAQYAQDRAATAFAERERLGHERQQHEAQMQRDNERATLMRKRAMLASGELLAYRGTGGYGSYSPEEAVARFDWQHGLAARPKAPAEETEGALVG